MKPDQLSNTAAFIPIKFYGLTLSEPYRSLFDEEIILFYDRLVEELPSPLNRYHYWLQKKWVRKIAFFSDEALLPGDLMHILMRKFYLNKMMEELTDIGYEQLIVLGSGFDHLAVRYSSAGLKCFEIDAPKMTYLKQELIKKFNYDSENLAVIAASLSKDSLQTILSNEKDMDLRLKTVIIAEGFFDYITPPDTKRILKDIVEYFENDVMLLSTVFALDELSLFRKFVFKTGVRMAGEQLQLHCSFSDFSSLLKKSGFDITKKVSADMMKQNILFQADINLPVLSGFYLLKAERQKF